MVVCLTSSSPATEPDSSGAGALFDRLDFHPSYSTRVDVNKTRRVWDQTLTMRKNSGRTFADTSQTAADWLRADNSWNVILEENPTQNDYRRRTGKMRARLESDLPGAGGLSAGTDLLVGRVFSGSDFDRTINNNSAANLFLSSSILGQLSRAVLGLPESQLDWTVTGSAGLTSQTTVSARRTGGKGGSISRWDSTDASGSSRGLDTQLTLERGNTLRLDALGTFSNGQDDSETQTFEPGRAQAYEVLPKEENEDRRRVMALNASWTPKPGTKVALNGQLTRTYKQFFSSQVRTRETTDGKDQRITLDLSFEPFWGIETKVTGKNTDYLLDYAVAEQDNLKRGNGIEGEIQFTTSKVFGFLRNIESITQAEWSKTHNSFGTAVPYDDRQLRLRQSLRRPLNSRLAVLLTAEENLSQLFYPGGDQDRDDLRLLLDGALGYKPSMKVDTRLTAQYTQKQLINVAADRSASSSNQNSYRIEASVKYQLDPSVQLDQKYVITADYTFYRFNERSNNLVRTTEVRTGLKSTIGKKAKLDLEHQYRFKDSGEYRYPDTQTGTGGLRLYSKATEETYQVLTATTRYEFSQGFNLHANQRMEVRRTVQVVSQKVTRTPKIEFTGGLDLDHRFDPDFSVNARIDRTQTYSTTSIADKNYWRISASLNRRF